MSKPTTMLRQGAPLPHGEPEAKTRPQLAAELLTALARLIVGHPDKLESRTLHHDGDLLLFLRPDGSDFGRLCGSGGAIHESLKRLGDLLALDGFVLMPLDIPKTESARISVKPFKPSEFEGLLRQLLEAMFNRDCSLTLSEEGSSIVARITVGSGWESQRVDAAASALQTALGAAARASGRWLRLSLREGRVAA